MIFVPSLAVQGVIFSSVAPAFVWMPYIFGMDRWGHIRIQDAHRIALLAHHPCKRRRYQRFTDSALAAHDSDHFLNG